MGTAETAVDQECVEAYLFHPSPLELLLLRRPPNRQRIWVPVSGKVDPDDADLASAARREVAEETGFREFARFFPLDWVVPFTGPDGRAWRLTAFAGELAGAETPRLSPEHEAFEWVDAAEATRRLHFEDNRAAVARLQHRLGALGPAASPNV